MRKYGLLNLIGKNQHSYWWWQVGNDIEEEIPVVLSYGCSRGREHDAVSGFASNALRKKQGRGIEANATKPGNECAWAPGT